MLTINFDFLAGSKLGKIKNGTLLKSCEKDEEKWAHCCPCTVIDKEKMDVVYIVSSKCDWDWISFKEYFKTRCHYEKVCECLLTLRAQLQLRMSNVHDSNMTPSNLNFPLRKKDVSGSLQQDNGVALNYMSWMYLHEFLVSVTLK